MRLSSNGKVIITIASAQCNGGPETTAIAPGGDQRRAAAGAAGDAGDARGLQGFGQGYRRQEGGAPPGRHRLPHPRWTEEEDVVVRTPASDLVLRL
jgi:hypothetical protein